ncbi:MAG: hypothetical protein QM765_43970 [Myxococcales bacterium]
MAERTSVQESSEEPAAAGVPPSPEARYLKRVLWGTALLVATVALVNLIADPFDVYRLVAVPSLNQAKPFARFHDRLQKAWAVTHLRPDTVVLGTSRAQIGIPASLLEEAGVASRPLNLGLPGGTVYEACRYLQHAEAAGEVRRAAVGLDLLMFNGASPRANPEFEERRLLVDAKGAPNHTAWAVDLAPTLLSLDALADSLRTVRRQDLGSYLLDDGTRNPATQVRSVAAAGGARELFRAAERTYFEWMRCFRLPHAPQDPPHLDDLGRLLDVALERGIAVDLFISPSHARHGQLVRLSGQWEAQRQWKRELVRRVEEAARRHPGSPALRLWDFSKAEGATVEAVPALSAKGGTMRWYWDSAHFTPALGERVLARLLNEADADPRFGMVLDSAHLDAQLAELDAAQDRWANEHPAEVEELAMLWREVQAKAAGSACRRASEPGTTVAAAP